MAHAQSWSAQQPRSIDLGRPCKQLDCEMCAKIQASSNLVFQGRVIFRMKRHQGRGMSGWREILGEKKMRGKVARQLHWMSRIKPNPPHAAPLPRPKFMRISEKEKCFFFKIEEYKKTHILIDMISSEPLCVTSTVLGPKLH